MQQIQQDVFVHGEERHLEESQDQELHRADFTQEGPKGDADRTHTEIGADQAGGGGKRRSGEESTEQHLNALHCKNCAPSIVAVQLSRDKEVMGGQL